MGLLPLSQHSPGLHRQTCCQGRDSQLRRGCNPLQVAESVNCGHCGRVTHKNAYTQYFYNTRVGVWGVRVVPFSPISRRLLRNFCQLC